MNTIAPRPLNLTVPVSPRTSTDPIAPTTVVVPPVDSFEVSPTRTLPTSGDVFVSTEPKQKSK
ncbi:MAG: hypothetical protein ACYC8T_33500, partial [Myxococcaceae bacterium]